jgi:hypothetical protein
VRPGLIKYIQKRSDDNTSRIPTISEHLSHGYHNKILSTEELKITLEQQLRDQNKKLNEIILKMNASTVKEEDPVRIL